ncbi:MAG TPA: hypothetical protein VGM56_20925 [Byssovorax sp.]|jgi:hypothetical protein
MSGLAARALGVVACVAAALAPAVARAEPPPATGPGYEPWTDNDPPAPNERYAIGDFGVRAGAEYRAQVIAVVPIALSSTVGENATWLEHRLRLDATVDYKDKIRIVASTDALDGVLWGDNGTFGSDPSSLAGTNVAARNPNETTPCIALRGGDPLQAGSYGYMPCSSAPMTFRKAYGEVLLPFGLLRVGRQPVAPGTGVQSADGDGRPNRFGVSGTGSIVDRALFATKPLEAFKPEGERDTSEDGLVAAIAYDRLVTDSPSDGTQAVNQIDAALRFRAPKLGPMRDAFANLYYVHRWDGQYQTSINGLGARAAMRLGDFRAGFDVVLNTGSTQEISAAYRVISNDPIVNQPILQGGGRVTARYDKRLWGVYLEADYASGDADPQVKTPLTQFVWAYDDNVGLLLFKRVLAYQTARSSAAAVELLKRLGATTFPAAEIDTHGAFTDAIALFPQVDFHPHKTVLLRGGVLVAWAAQKLIDPVASLKARDGVSIQDDLVNYVGGKPGSFYGVELDGRFQWRFMEHFAFDLEGAVLFPGDALQDVDGYAVRSSLVQARTTFFL